MGPPALIVPPSPTSRVSSAAFRHASFSSLTSTVGP
jgi:hypothetical protein